MTKKKEKYQDCRGPGIYKICVEGHLKDRWKDWFGCLKLTRKEDGFTILCCDVPDQTALHSVLQKIRDLNLQLVSFEKIEKEAEKGGCINCSDC